MRRFSFFLPGLMIIVSLLAACNKGQPDLTLGSEQPVILVETLMVPSALPNYIQPAPPTMVPVMATATPYVVLPHPIPEDGKGNLVGQVRWNEEGVPDIELKICTDFQWFGGCKGTLFTTRSGQDGIYVFNNVTPGTYVLTLRLFNTSEWVYLTSGFFNEREFTVRAGETTEAGVNDIFKKDLKMVSPAEKAILPDARPTLSWAAYPDATYYKLWVNPAKGDSVVSFDELETNQYTPSVDLFNCEYTWKVEAFNKNGTKLAEFPDYQHFTINGAAYSCTVKLLKPLNNSTVPASGIELEWEAHPLADSYKLFVWPENDSSVHILDFLEVRGTTYTISETLQPGKYVLSIYAYDASGKGIAASDVSYFIVH